MQMTSIERLAAKLLDERETLLSERLTLLLDDNAYDAQSLVEKIIPIYWERADDIDITLSPDNVYRPLYYIHGWSSNRDFRNITRAYMQVISSHLEGCLKNLTPAPPKHRASTGPFGSLVAQLKASGILSAELADHLGEFNDAINVPSKHFNAYMPTKRLNERTFSVRETAYALVLMRKLSIQLFAILKSSGVALPQEWPEFKNEWLSWSGRSNQDPETN